VRREEEHFIEGGNTMARRAKKMFRINGKVVDRKTKQGVAGLKVKAWDKNLVVNDLVGSTTTDEKGAFRIEFAESYFKELFFDRKPDLFFKVFHDKTLIKSTEDSVLFNVEAGDSDVVIDGEFISIRFRDMAQTAGTQGADTVKLRQDVNAFRDALLSEWQRLIQDEVRLYSIV
jgi:hypothetical protein